MRATAHVGGSSACSCGRCCTRSPGTQVATWQRYLSVSICIHAGQASANLKHPDLVPPASIVIQHHHRRPHLEQKQPPRWHGMTIVCQPCRTDSCNGTGTGSPVVGAPSISFATAKSLAVHERGPSPSPFRTRRIPWVACHRDYSPEKKSGVVHSRSSRTSSTPITQVQPEQLCK